MSKRSKVFSRLAVVGVAVLAALAAAIIPSVANADTNPGAAERAKTHAQPKDAGDGTAQGAVDWYAGREGSTDYEHYCEKAAENAWGTTGVWASAIAHWQGSVDAGKAHPGDTNPPLGAFVYWDISQYGHVGVSDGNGGFWSTGYEGAIGHGTDLNHFDSYLGWSDPEVPFSKTGSKVQH
ncbi:MAG TPA: CHAP domain-containing protein [Stackebrandtia sp.]|uniref:CHAP domain-containing protein n=1 Tax=Stackebrandtia sp. TaxID=2023065 RepID=UPI002D476B65|nr:CHAP domain-containing protein [Stackebrandtia sp.]HZE40233.1 CHAP domain-containing protein [Stackebrandtia sp.]